MAASADATAEDFGRRRDVSLFSTCCGSTTAEFCARADCETGARHAIAPKSNNAGLSGAVFRLDLDADALEERRRQNTSGTHDNGIVVDCDWLT